MNYARPDYLPAIFVIIFILTIFYVWAMKRRSKLLMRFADRHLIRSIAPSASPARKAFKMSIMTAAAFLALFVLARPQWGFEWTETKHVGLDILIAIDVSKSMLAADVKPNRLERSKFAVKDLMRKLNGDRVGLIAFAGTAFLQCPLTIDYNGFLLALDDLNVGTIPRPGTSISGAIKEAIGLFKGPEKDYKILVIITDGEDLEGDAPAAASRAAELGIKIYCVGVGTPEGELIPAFSESGERGYLTDKSGKVVKTKLNEDMLKEIAISTGGSYVRATQAEFGLVLLYDRSISKLEKHDIETKMRKSYHERYQYFLSFAVLLLILEMLIPDRKRMSA